ncbi:MAG: hypothetical protein ACI923_002251 [Flavobacteriales bacterium]|jgi:hypothetical protein
MKKIYAIAAVLLFTPALMNSQSFSNSDEMLPGTYNSGGCVGVNDMNQDGIDDIVLLDDANHLRILYGSGEGFDEVDYGTVSGNSQWGFSIGDMSNDGHNDVISGGAYDGVHYVEITSPGVFESSGLPNGSMFMQACNIADINNDGWLDFFGCHDDATSRMWRNDGAGGMVTDAALINLEDYALTDYPGNDHSGNYGTVWSDVDDDGDIDLLIAKCRQFISDPQDPRRVNQLWINDGNNNYTEDALDRGLVFYEQSWTADMADYNNDGYMDALITNHSTNLMLLENDGTGNFTDVTAAVGLMEEAFFLQAKMEDLNNDGWVDLIYSGGEHKVYMNNGDGTFSEEVNLLPNGDTMHSFALGDFDKDGSIDVYASYGNIYVDSDNGNPDRLWMNDGNENNWIGFELEGIISNQNAIGAKVKIYGDFGVQVREVRAGESYGIVNTFALHFGVGSLEEIDSVVINWPSGFETVIDDPTLNVYNYVIEAECQIDPVTIAANGGTTICPGETVTIEAPEGYTYSWNNGAETQSIVVTQQGNYSVTVFDEGNCAGGSNNVVVTVVEPNIPTISVNGDLEFCSGGSVELIASDAAEYDWSTGDDVQAITVTESTVVTVSTIDVCASALSSEEVTITVYPAPSAPVVENVTINEPGTADLTGSGTALHWYDAEDATDPLYVGDTFTTPSLEITSEFWVEDVLTNGGEQAEGGRLDNSGDGEFFNNEGRYQIFDANEDMMLLSIRTYADEEGDRVFAVLNSNGETLASGTFNVPSGESVVELDFFVPAGENHSLRCTSANPGLYRNGPPAEMNYPYEIGDLATITSSSVTGDNATAYYYFFYDWVVSTPMTQCVSERVLVTVTLVGVEEIEALTSFSVYPNPASALVQIDYALIGQSNVSMELVDLTGRVIMSERLTAVSGENRHVFDVSNLSTGLYQLSLVVDGQRATYKLLVD